jgi:hypothetical protein
VPANIQPSDLERDLGYRTLLQPEWTPVRLGSLYRSRRRKAVHESCQGKLANASRCWVHVHALKISDHLFPTPFPWVSCASVLFVNHMLANKGTFHESSISRSSPPPPPSPSSAPNTSSMVPSPSSSRPSTSSSAAPSKPMVTSPLT